MAFDAEYQQAAVRTFERLGIPTDRPIPRFPRGDIVSRRRGGEAWLEAVLGLDTTDYSDIERKEYRIPGYNGAEISLFAYRKKQRKSSSSQPAVLYIHGGGMILGSAMLFEKTTKADVAATRVDHFSVEYRLAPENPHPTPVEDCYAALVWLSMHAKELGVDPTRIGVAGLSAGGGLAAGVALLARDRGLHPPIAKQILLCPMLDDRNTRTDEALLPLVTWSWDDNWTGWNALLAGDQGSSSVSQYAAPSRAESLQNLPPTYIDVGSLDIFLEENKVYADRLREAGVDVEYHMYNGVPHGFEFRAEGTEVLSRTLSNRHKAIQRI